LKSDGKLYRESLETKVSIRLELKFRLRHVGLRARRLAKTFRLPHHDRRHFFATLCIESNEDIPTVSRWLGHSDSGALLIKTYGHSRRDTPPPDIRRLS
jgi:integrase